MKISNNEIQKALKIKNAVQHYLEMTKEVNIRSTDVFPYLVRKGIYEADKNNGLFFRRFLKRLYKANMLKSLIPQCTYVPGNNGEVFGEWYFNLHKRQEEKITDDKCLEQEKIEIKEKDISLEQAKEILFQLLEGMNPETGKLIDHNESPLLLKISKSLKVFIENDEGGEMNETQEVDQEKNATNKIDKFSGSKTGLIRNEITPPSYTIMEIRKSYANAYKPWTREEEELLVELYKRNYKPKDIALKLKRQNGAIYSRIKKLGLEL